VERAAAQGEERNREGGRRPKGWKGWGGGCHNWEERGSARVGVGGGLPSIGSRSKARTRSPI
jgi:hypothetical protein